MTATPFDGQYQGAHEGHAAGLDVLRHLALDVGLNVRWVLSRWDGAHRIELGQDTVRQKTPFYRALAGIISHCHEKYFLRQGQGASEC